MSKLKVVFILLAAFIFHEAQAQLSPASQARVDSLEEVVSSAANDTTKIRACQAIYDIGRAEDFGLAVEMFFRLDSITDVPHLSSLSPAEQKVIRKGRGFSHWGLGYIMRAQALYDSSFYYYESAFAIYMELQDTVNAAQQLTSLGVISQEQTKYDQSIAYHQQSLALFEKIGAEEDVATTLNNMANTYRLQGDLGTAIAQYTRGLEIFERSGNQTYLGYFHLNIGTIYEDLGDEEKTIEHYRKSYYSYLEVNDPEGLGLAMGALATYYLNQDELDSALYLNQQAVLHFREGHNPHGLSTSLHNMGSVLQSRGSRERALRYFEEAREIRRVAGDQSGEAGSIIGIAGIYLERADSASAVGNDQLARALRREAQAMGEEAYAMAAPLGAFEAVQDASLLLYEVYKLTNRPADALRMHEVYLESRDSLTSDNNRRAVLRTEYQHAFDQQHLADSLEFARKEAVKDLTIAKNEADLNTQRVVIGATIGGLLLLLVLAYFIYRGKKRSDELLLNILPEETAEELKKHGSAEAKQHDEVTVLFTDFKGFTQMAEHLTPKALVEQIDECFKAFDLIMEKYGVEKIKTIGDAYMAAGGVPTSKPGHTKDVVKAALEIRDFMLKRRAANRDEGFEIRIGLHTGPVVAGIVGIKKFSYDIWGDTVNTASRMESSGAVGQVNISASVYQRVEHDFKTEYRGEIEAKGKGKISMYFVDWPD